MMILHSYVDIYCRVSAHICGFSDIAWRGGKNLDGSTATWIGWSPYAVEAAHHGPLRGFLVGKSMGGSVESMEILQDVEEIYGMHLICSPPYMYMYMSVSLLYIYISIYYISIPAHIFWQIFQICQAKLLKITRRTFIERQSWQTGQVSTSE